MTSQEKTELVALIDSSRKDFLAALAESNPEALSRKPDSGAWSIMECAEHVVLVERAFLRRLTAAPRTAEGARHPELELRIRSATDRTNRIQAPEQVHPSGRYTSIDEIKSKFADTRDRMIEFVQSSGELLFISGAHPLFGPMNGYEMILFVCTHSLRHREQIREIQERLRTTA